MRPTPYIALALAALTLTACGEDSARDTSIAERTIIVQGCDATQEANDGAGACQYLVTTCALDATTGERTHIGPIYHPPELFTDVQGCAVYKDGAICPLPNFASSWLTRSPSWTSCTLEDEMVLNAMRRGPPPPPQLSGPPVRLEPYP